MRCNHVIHVTITNILIVITVIIVKQSIHVDHFYSNMTLTPVLDYYCTQNKGNQNWWDAVNPNTWLNTQSHNQQQHQQQHQH
jgi:hypothetical protein